VSSEDRQPHRDRRTVGPDHLQELVVSVDRWVLSEVPITADAPGGHGAPGLLGQGQGGRVLAVHQETAVRRHGRHQLPIGRDVGDEIGVEVGMVQLQVEQGHHLGMPLQELGPVIQGRGCVLVALEDERRAPLPV